MKLPASLAAITLAFLLAACGDSSPTATAPSSPSPDPVSPTPVATAPRDPDAGKVVITVITPPFDDPTWKTIKAGFLASLEKRKGAVALHWQVPADSEATAAALVDQQITDKVGALIFAGMPSQFPPNQLAKAAAANIPVILVKTSTTSDAYVTRVTVDDAKLGALAAQKLIALVAGKGTLAVAPFTTDGTGDPSPAAAFAETAMAAGLTVTTDFDPASLAQGSSSKTPDGIYTPDAASTRAVLKAMQTWVPSDIHPKIYIIATDTSEETLAALKSGTIAGLALRANYRLGYESLDATLRAIMAEKKRNTLPKLKLVDPVFITLETLTGPAATDALGPKAPPAIEK